MKNLLIKNKKSGGFTLIELLVVITIFVTLTVVVIFNQKSFDDTILLNNLAYDMALTIKQAQVYGVSIREAASSTPVFPSYGVYFDIGSDPKSFILFADTNFNGKYDGTSACSSLDTECVQKFNINRGNFIKSICVGANGNCNNITKAKIYFQRPNPEANIYYSDASGTYVKKDFIEINLSSQTGVIKNIIVTSVGQIYVK